MIYRFYNFIKLADDDSAGYDPDDMYESDADESIINDMSIIILSFLLCVLLTVLAAKMF